MEKEYAMIDLDELKELMKTAYMRGYEDSEDGNEPNPEFELERTTETQH